MEFYKNLYLDFCFSVYFFGHLSFIMKEANFGSYAENNTPYVTPENLDDVFKSLEEYSSKLIQ